MRELTVFVFGLLHNPPEVKGNMMLFPTATHLNHLQLLKMTTNTKTWCDITTTTTTTIFISCPKNIIKINKYQEEKLHDIR